jgi:hypothetical protein
MFNKTETKTTTQLVEEVRLVMSDELGITLSKDQAVERLTKLYLQAQK